MLKLTAYVSGNVQSVGYRAKVADLAQSLNLRGAVENLPDGRVKVTAEGMDEDLESLCRGLQMSNGLIDVKEIVASYSEPSGDYEGFVKLVSSGETDQRLDIGVQYIKELIDVTRSGFESMGNKIDCLGGKIDRIGEKMDIMLTKQDQTNRELQGFRADLKDHMDRRFDRLEEKLDRSLNTSPPKQD